MPSERVAKCFRDDLNTSILIGVIEGRLGELREACLRALETPGAG